MEEFKMARQTKREYLGSIHDRYQRAGRREKGSILEEFCKVCGYNRSAQDIPKNCDTVRGLRCVEDKGERWLRDGAGWKRIQLGLSGGLRPSEREGRPASVHY